MTRLSNDAADLVPRTDFDGPEPYDPNPYCQQNGLPVAECWASELDVFEGYGRINVGAPDDPVTDFFSGALHRNTAGFYGQPNEFRFVQRRTGLDLSEWHVYAALWTDSTVSYYVDGQLMGSVPTYDSTRQPMHLLLYNWNTPWEDENMPNADTPDQLDVSVDVLRSWLSRAYDLCTTVGQIHYWLIAGTDGG